jgi:hypothetical protein
VFAGAVVAPAGGADFYGLRSGELIARQLAAAIEAEGPISRGVLFGKVARAWGLQRVGGRMVERMEGLVAADVVRTVEATGPFYWPRGTDLESWDAPRTAVEADSATHRALEDVALRELGAIALRVLSLFGSSSESALARQVCRAVGLQKTSAAAGARVGEALKLLQASGRVRLDGATWRRS